MINSIPDVTNAKTSWTRKDKKMKFWTALFSTVLVACSLSSATRSQSAPHPKAGSALASLPKITPEIAQWLLASSRSYKLSKVGDGFAKQGDWQDAQDCYQQALDQFPTNRDALYGMAECSRVAGDTNKEIEYDRKAFYSSHPGQPGDDGFRTLDTAKLMKFALLLSQAGYADEAMTVYNYAAGQINFTDKKPNLAILLPAFGLGPGKLPYSSKRFQAMAHLGLGVSGLYNEFLSDEEKRGHLDEAIRLQPDMAVAYFYKAQALAGRAGRLREARDAFRAAALHGDAATRAEVDKAMKASSIEGNAQVEQDLENQHKKQAAQKKQ